MPGRGKIEPRWKKGESGNPKGRPKGAKTRATIVKKWLEAAMNVTDPVTKIKKKGTIEDNMVIAMIARALGGDVPAFNSLMDSAYGKPTQKIDQSENQQTNVTVNIS